MKTTQTRRKTMSERSYPDIDFIETDPEQILTDLILAYEEISGYVLQPASPERLFIAWIASVIVQQRVIINEVAKMNVPRYAEGEKLESLGELFHDVKRLPSTSAEATFRCYISKAQKSSVYIPEGTRITADGDIMFATKELLEIKAGEMYGDVVGICKTAGEEGNGYQPGQIKEIVDVYDYYKKIENITESAGGAEEESDADYYERMRESAESVTTAGPMNSYIYHAKSVSSAITDAVATSKQPGVVDVRVLLKGGEEATETILKKVEEALTKDDVRPMTDLVTVSTPEKDEYNIDLDYYISKNSSESAKIIENDIKEAVENYVLWQSEKMGRDINPSKLISLVMGAGAKRVDVREPIFKIVEDTHVATLKEKNVTNGGIEDA